MKNLKFYKTKTRLLALALSITVLGSTAVGCKRKDNTDNVTSNPYASYQTMVDETNGKIDSILPEVNNEIVDNATIMLLLDIFAKEDENGKISADAISQFKSKIDADDMINEFNAFLDIIGQKAILEGEVEKLSTVLPEELKNDSVILSNIETIVENIIKYSNEGNKNSVVSEFNKIYTLFVEEKEIEVDGVKFEIRDLTNPSRAVATTYAEVAAYYSRNYITKEQYEKIDARTDDQNNKAYIKSDLEILSNQMEEKSETDVIDLFDKKYTQVSELLSGKVNLSEATIKNLINYLNLKYIDSDKVATKDINQILGEYEDEKVSDALIAIEAINAYNLNNQNSIIPFSVFLVDNYLTTETGKIDSVALDYVQYNTIMLNNTVTTEVDYLTLKNNPYFENIYKYFTKQDFTHVQNDENKDIIWQEISDGANFINYQVILCSLNKLPKVDNKDNYIEITQENLEQSIQYIQNTIMDECKKVDATEYVLTK